MATGSPGPTPQERRPSRLRSAVFALAVLVAVLAAVNQVVELAERRGLVSTQRPDDAVLFLDEALFERSGSKYTTTAYAEQRMVASSFDAAPPESRWRLFATGASFMMGSPLRMQGSNVGWGGIPDWLQLRLEERFPAGDLEVINAAQSAQTSHRVLRVVASLLELEPDALLVATCNNEGVLSPGALREALHRHGGYRLLARLLAPPPRPEERSLFTPQDEQLDRIRDEFRQNIRGMVQLSGEAGVPLFLSTLPVHLAYTGREVGHLPGDEATRPHEPLSDCVAEGRQKLLDGDLEGANELLLTCEDVADSLVWIARVLGQQGAVGPAREALEQSVELAPRNRCRPSFNAIVREEAAAAEHVTLVDLQAAADQLSPDGIPSEALFVDSCHMNARGYAEMSDVVADAIAGSPWAPRSTASARPPAASAAIASENGLAWTPGPLPSWLVLDPTDSAQPAPAGPPPAP